MRPSHRGRTTGAVGGFYALSGKARLDLSLAHDHVDDTVMDNSETLYAGAAAARRVGG
ncbi:MAG: hypothetical protein ACOYJ6_10355 [Caulobacterales bacterium]|jgi:hypothetical protein